MNQDKYVFAQFVTFLDRNHFNYLVRKYSGDRYVKHFTCWNQLLVMMFGQLTNRESLRDLIVIIEAHRSKCYHLGFGKHITKSNLAKANQNRVCRIFEEFAYFLVAEARSKRITDIFKLGGSVYAFDSTTIDLCLSVFWWAKFHKHKGGIKIHTLYDIETQVPAFFHITEASVNDVRAMDELAYEPGAYYIFDRGYNDFSRLHRITCTDSYFVVRAKKNLQYRAVRWRRHINNPTLSGCKSRSVGYLSRLYPSRVGDTQQ
ncbi:MAG: IS4 family transposase [Bacteroidales bacterium]|nr:IS4 family transposase [Bacteroidales bacterium]